MTIRKTLIAAAFVASTLGFGAAIDQRITGKAQRFAHTFVSLEQSEINFVERFVASYLRAETKPNCRS